MIGLILVNNFLNLKEKDMSINLSKGSNINLTKEAPGLTEVTAGLGWKARITDGVDFDLNALAFMLDENGKSPSEKHVVFYNNLQSENGAIVHSGDNRTGDADGDDETITIKLNEVPANIHRIVVAVSIHDAQTRNQNFGQVSDSYIRVVNSVGNVELAKFDLGEDASTQVVLTFGELYRNNGDWKFRAVGEGFAGGLQALAASFGV